jgi:hypothetical protein
MSGASKNAAVEREWVRDDGRGVAMSTICARVAGRKQVRLVDVMCLNIHKDTSRPLRDSPCADCRVSFGW